MPGQPIPFDDVNIDEYNFWFDQLQVFSGQRAVSAELVYDDNCGYSGWFPSLQLEDDTVIWLLSDEEENAPGRFEIRRP